MNVARQVGVEETVQSGPVVFIDVPKSAGSSLQTMFEKSVGVDALCKTHTLDQLDSEASGRYLVFAGHFDFSQSRLAPSPLRLITMLRDPVERVISLYWYFRSITQAEFERTRAPIDAFAKSVGMKDSFYLAPPHVRAQFQNYATRLIVGGDLCEGPFGFSLPDADILKIAKKRLSEMTAFGLAERSKESTRYIFSALGIPYPGEQRVNVLTDRMTYGDADQVETNGPSESLRRYLNQINALDRQVYDFATDLFATRISQERL